MVYHSSLQAFHINSFYEKPVEMNASDIVKAKQSKVLYNTYYKPFLSASTIHQSTILSTLSLFSSFGSTVTNSKIDATSSITSCITTSFITVNTPTFQSYETRQLIKDGGYECGAASQSQSVFGGVPTTIYSYRPVTLPITGINVPVTTSFIIDSTIVTEPKPPVIGPFITFNQGCNTCTKTSCTGCTMML